MPIDISTSNESIVTALNNKVDLDKIKTKDITGIDLNLIKESGSYISFSTKKELHYPNIYTDKEEISSLSVSNIDNKTIQILSLGKYTELIRTCTDDVWNGWTCLGGILNKDLPSNDISVYVSKEGDDNNSGLTQEDAVATIDEAFKRLYSINLFSGESNFRLRLGPGDWGTCIIDSFPYCLVISSFSDIPYSEYNENIPRFASFLVRDCSNILIENIDSDFIDCRHNSYIRFNEYYHKIGYMQCCYHSTIGITAGAIFEIIPGSHNCLFHLYTNASVLSGSNVTLKFTDTTTYTDIFYIKHSKCIYAGDFTVEGEDFLTVSGYFVDIRLGGEFININSSPQTEINFPKNNKIRLDNSTSFNYNTPRIQQPLSYNLHNNEYFNTWIDVDPDTGLANTNTYSNWSIWPKTSQQISATEKRLAYLEFSRYKDTQESSFKMVANKGLGSNSGQSTFTVRWDTNPYTNELEAIATAPTPSKYMSGITVATLDSVNRVDWYPNLNDGAVELIIDTAPSEVKATDMNLLTKIGKWHIAIDFTTTKNIPQTIVDLFSNEEVHHNNVTDAMIEIFHIGTCSYISSYTRYMQRLTIFASTTLTPIPIVFVRTQRNMSDRSWSKWLRLNTTEEETANPSTQEASVSPLNEYNGVEYADGCYPDEYYTTGAINDIK